MATIATGWHRDTAVRMRAICGTLRLPRRARRSGQLGYPAM